MGKFANLLGTVLDRFQFGLSGPLLKNDSGQISARNATDSAYAAIRAALVRVFGDSLELNAGAAEAGADWRMTLQRPSSGMSTNIDIILPPGTPSPGQLLRVAAYSSGTVTLEYAEAGEGASNVLLVDETDIAFGTSSPAALLTKPANALLDRVKIIIDEPFNGTNPQASIGISGETSKYAAASHIDLKAAAGSVFELDYGEPATGGTEDIIATLSPDSSTEGAARIQLYYVIPS